LKTALDNAPSEMNWYKTPSLYLHYITLLLMILDSMHLNLETWGQLPPTMFTAQLCLWDPNVHCSNSIDNGQSYRVGRQDFASWSSAV